MHDSAASVFPSPAPSGESSRSVSAPGLAQSHLPQLPLSSDAAGSLPPAQFLSPPSHNVSPVEPAADAQDAGGSSRAVDVTDDGSLGPGQALAVLDASLDEMLAERQVAGQPTAATKHTMTQANSARGEAMPGGGEVQESSDRRAKRRRGDESQVASAPPPVPLAKSSFSYPWLLCIEHRLQVFGPAREISRYKLLYDACGKGDLFYIVLHQLFCLWSAKREYVYAWLEPEPQVVDSAFDLLLQAFMITSEMAAFDLEWFASFPLGYPDVVSHVSRHQVQLVLSQISLFVRHFATGWGRALAYIDERRYPLLVCEMEGVLMCTSPTLQWVLFTSSSRRLGIDDVYASVQELHSLFTMDRNNELLHRGGDLVESGRVRVTIARRYREMVAQAEGKSCYMHSFLPTCSFADALLPLASASAPASAPASGPIHFPGSSQAFVPSSVNAGSASYPTARPTAMYPYASPSSNASAPPFHPGFDNGSAQGHGHDPRHLPPRYADARLVFDTNPAMMPGPRSRPVAGHAFPPRQPSSPSAGQAFSAPLPTGQVLSQAAPHLVPPWPIAHHGPTAAGPAMQRPLSGDTLGFGATSDAARTSIPQLAVPQPRQQQMAPAAHQPAPVWRPDLPRARPPPVNSQRPCSSPAARPLGLGYDPRRLAYSQHRTLPLREHELPQTDLQRVQHGLHLEALRSPKRAPSKPCTKRFYQFISHFAVEPRAFPPRKGLRELKFSVSEEELSRMVQTTRTGGAAKALYSSRSLRYRLRLCKQHREAQQVQATHWTISPGFWPQTIFLECNGQPVRPRRRQHFQYDAPIELSDLVRPGENTIQVSLPEVPANMGSSSTYFMGVEVITTLDYEAVRDLIEAAKHISADETVREIQRRLKPGGTDDVMSEDDHICVSVADPFSSCLFETPVRGVDCKHIECFDLDIWLLTRSRKPSQDPGEPCLVDCWKCPICALDARPVSLRVDDFFAEVQRELAQSDGVSTKHISIKPDGSWKRVQEADEAEGPATEAQGQPRTAQAPSADSNHHAIVIIDDD